MVLKRGRKRETNIAILQSALKEVATLTGRSPQREQRNNETKPTDEDLPITVVEPAKGLKKKGIKKDAVINTKMLLT